MVLHRGGRNSVRSGLFVVPPNHESQAPSGAALSLENGFQILDSLPYCAVANTYSQIYLHVVFAVEGRQNLIKPDYNSELQRYIAGIVLKRGQKPLAINNMPDHLHMLIGLKPDIALSDLVRDVKAGSSKFISEQNWVLGRFSWQEGFGAFSYSRSQLDDVIHYINQQQKHHAKKSFREEYIEMLEKFGTEYDPRFIFKTEGL